MAIKDMEAEQVDINNAFTKSHLKERIYIRLLKGLKIKAEYILRILKSLYSLKQSAYKWNNTCHKRLIKMGFRKSTTDLYVYYRIKNNTIIGLYIDDMLILVSKGNQQVINNIKKSLRRRFKLKELGKVSKILGIRVTRDRVSRAVYLD